VTCTYEYNLEPYEYGKKEEKEKERKCKNYNAMRWNRGSNRRFNSSERIYS